MAYVFCSHVCIQGFAGQVDEFAKELQFLYKLQHRHIVPFFGLYISNAYEGATSKRYFLVTKFAEKGHLGEHLTTRVSMPSLHWASVLALFVH